MNRTDFLVIGGGVLGLTTALELRRRYPDQRVAVLEKETSCGQHASGRNSGVLHAGFYYSAESLKAKFCREGNAWWRQYCEGHGLRMRRCGKLVVARDDTEVSGLAELHRRGMANGVELELIDAAAAAEIEPRAKTHRCALWSPTTTSVDPAEAMARLVGDATDSGVEIWCGRSFAARRDQVIHTSDGQITAGYVVNTAGAYADRVARAFGFCANHTILPFKGLYLYGSASAGELETNIYPVPDLDYPFLGVHFTVAVDGTPKIGPTATPAFWREHYRGLENFDARELAAITSLEARLLWRAGFPFRRLALEELKKYRRSHLVRQAARLVHGISMRDYRKWGRPGIRAQLVDRRDRTLVMDFHIEGDAGSLHVLNAVSPGFTCAAPFASHICDRISTLTGGA